MDAGVSAIHFDENSERGKKGVMEDMSVVRVSSLDDISAHFGDDQGSSIYSRLDEFQKV